MIDVFFIHLPERSLPRNNNPLTQSSMHIAIQTPTSPMVEASNVASVIRTIHMLARFMMHGTNVSPAPTITP